jgi:hypothetical protein
LRSDNSTDTSGTPGYMGKIYYLKKSFESAWSNVQIES